MNFYEKLIRNFKLSLKKFPTKKHLTFTEKIIYAHLSDSFKGPSMERGSAYLKLKPDRVAMQDASAQMALLQFMSSGKKATAIPTSVHCDHLIQAQEGAEKDLKASLESEKEIYDFLSSCSQKYGLSFWKPGSGIIHQIVLENYATPGGLLLGTDSHTPNAGGLGMMAIGVGGMDAVDAMADIPWELKAPKILGIHLKGELNGWASPKDVILYLAGKLSVKGGTGYVLEYFGEGTQKLSCTGMATICNMGAEVGATTSLFTYSQNMKNYLLATGRAELAEAADKVHQETGYLSADRDSEENYDDVIEIDLSKLEPHVNGPFSPDLAIPISQLKKVALEKGWPLEIKSSLIGSCTNSSYQDMSKAAAIAKQATDAGLKPKSPLLVTPGSEQIRATIERDGYTAELEKAGATVLANACGPCIGQWKRKDVQENEPNVILTSFNRNFRARNDGHSKTMNFLASPEMVTAMSFAGSLDFDPTRDQLQTSDGKTFQFQPVKGKDLPEQGFTRGRLEFQPQQNPEPQSEVEVKIDPKSQRLQKLDRFEPWTGKELEDMVLLLKVDGKCTTDHISAAGSWLKYKGHLDNLSHNTLMGAHNFYLNKTNAAVHYKSKKEMTIPELARTYKKENQNWLLIADDNYGEGSAREHAALQPRYLGCKMIIAKSFARIHETNLKKQGVLPVTWDMDPQELQTLMKEHGDLIQNGQWRTLGLVDILNGDYKKQLKVQVQKGNQRLELPVKHTMSSDQWHWFKAGSALNSIQKN